MSQPHIQLIFLCRFSAEPPLSPARNPVEFRCGSQEELTSAATKEIARKERERLKAQDKYKRDQLEKLRAEQNTDASSGEVCRP